MKLKAFITVIILLIITGSAFAQDKQASYTKMIVGTWKVDSLELGSLKLSAEYEKIVKDKMVEIIATTEVKFSSNKKYLKKVWKVQPKVHGASLKMGNTYLLSKMEKQILANR